jgi:hypothetical protein
MERRGIERGRQEEARTIAAQMVAEGFDIATIRRLTGLADVVLDELIKEH